MCVYITLCVYLVLKFLCEGTVINSHARVDPTEVHRMDVQVKMGCGDILSTRPNVLCLLQTKGWSVCRLAVESPAEASGRRVSMEVT